MRLAIWLPNGPEWARLALAAKARSEPVIAINTRFRAHEVQDILRRGEATHLAYWPGFHGIDFDAILADIDADVELIDARALPELETGDGDPDAPWMIFTSSGTTGAPKLVVHAQRGMDAHAAAVADSFGYRDEATVLCALPLCGVFGFCTFLGARAAGAKTVFLDVFDARRASALIAEHGVTHTTGTDVMFQRLFEHPTHSLREAGFAAFNLAPRPLVDAADERGITLYQCYGASEIQALVAHAPADASADERAKAGGTPISDRIDVRIVDDEIQVKGPNVMAGYLNDDEHPFTADGYYRTGDLGRETELGFEYLSRGGDALRLSGFLVHPREIEAYIEQLDGVQAAGVIEHEGAAVAFIVGDPAGVQAHCQAGLAGYKVPRRVIALDALPTAASANGERVQRAQLRRLL
jgi:fatty-acyl-CoA synthase